MIKKKIICIALVLVSINVHAAFNGITDHSRANCVNNESITWDYLESHWLAVVSFHTIDYLHMKSPYYDQHRIEAYWDSTRRAAAVHWGEVSPFDTLVNGYHWQSIGGQDVLRNNTLVTGCSLYNGWWDW